MIQDIQKRVPVIIIVLLLSVIVLAGSYVLVGCSLQWEEVAFSPGGPGALTQYPSSSPMISIATTTEEATKIKHLWDDHLEAIREVDFNTYIVAVIYLGTDRDGHETFRVSSVRLKGNTITVRVKIEPPPRGMPRTNIEISPYFVLKIKKTARLRGTKDFVLIVNRKKAAQKTHDIPVVFTSPIAPR